MLSVFPQILFLTPFSPMLLRIAAGLVFLYIALAQWQRREQIADVRYPVIGGGIWTLWIGLIYEIAVAIMLIVGYLTQIAALLGILAAIKFILLKRSYPEVISLSRVSSSLLLVILISLLVTGAGLFAVDLPL